jgi:hypothetical protein
LHGKNFLKEEEQSYLLIIGVGVLLFVGIYFSFCFDSRIEVMRKYYPLQGFANTFYTSLDMILLKNLNASSDLKSKSITIQIQNDDGYTKHGNVKTFTFSGNFHQINDETIYTGIQSINKVQDLILSEYPNEILILEKYQFFSEYIFR